jgi:AraC-like DNA-binding protein
LAAILTNQANSRFFTNICETKSVADVWHYHSELELHYVVQGEGVRIVGNNISKFSAGEIVFLGQRLPHNWKFVNNHEEAKVIVLHFIPDFLGKHFLEIPEANSLPKLFERAKKGLFIKGTTKDALAALIQQAVKAINLDRAIILLSILKLLSETTEFSEIISASHSFYEVENKTLRWHKVYDYTLANYHKKIKLEDVASVGNLSVTSFCRYFKLVTRISYYDFLTEIRISHACRLLTWSTLSIETTCYACGFNNMSNFYRHFKKYLGVTPRAYQQRYSANRSDN